VLVDGQMKVRDWIRIETGIWKTDIVQHNFGGPEFDIVDVAYDLAGAVFEFRMSEEDEIQMVRCYIAETGDEAVLRRLILHKLLYAQCRPETCGRVAGAARAVHVAGGMRRTALPVHLGRYCATVAACDRVDP
jgi:hypothetical protein